MGWFILAIFAWLAAIVAITGSLFAGEDSGARGDRYSNPSGFTVTRTVARVTGAVAVAIGFGLFAWSGMKSVPVKNIGVPQSFGAVGSDVYGPGIHETWRPWVHLTDIDETVQTTTFEDKNCLTVRIGGQQSACADITIQWQILPQAAGGLFSDYANQGNLMTTVEDAVVIRELKQVVNDVVGDYNPITDVQTITNSTSSTSQFSTFGPVILQRMRADIGSRIKVLTVLMPFIHYDASVEAKLQGIQQAYANYAIGVENVKVNQEQALALARLGTPNLNQLVAQCLSDLKQDSGSLPAGFQCIPGSSTTLALSK